MKKVYEEMYYVVYFSDTPEPGSYSDEMLKIALKYGIIDEVRYLLPVRNQLIELQ
jgi:hypothetical protein